MMGAQGMPVLALPAMLWLLACITMGRTLLYPHDIACIEWHAVAEGTCISRNGWDAATEAGMLPDIRQRRRRWSGPPTGTLPGLSASHRTAAVVHGSQQRYNMSGAPRAQPRRNHPVLCLLRWILGAPLQGGDAVCVVQASCLPTIFHAASFRL